VKKREGKVCEGESYAFGADGKDVDTVAAVVGEGREKVVSTVLVRVPRETVNGAVKGKA
jgi:hypothetical protein